jgi:hypothetical protein
MRVFKTKPFARFANREGIEDRDLCEAVRRAEAGLIDADLGGGVLKQRIARRGQGKSGGFRSIVLYRRTDRAFFVYGFAKNHRANIERDELGAFRDLAKIMLGYDSGQIEAALENELIIEVCCHEKKVP